MKVRILRWPRNYKNVKFDTNSGTPKNHWRGCAARFSKSWPYFRPKHGIFHTGFQTWPLKSILVFKPGGGHKTQHTCLRRQIISSLLRWERQQKNIFLKIHFEFAYYGFISYPFRTNRQICSYTTVAPLKTIPDSRPKRAQKPLVTLWGGTYLNGLYREVTPPPPTSRNTCHKQRL